MELNQILSEINILLPQLEDFINQFNTTITESGVSVVTDETGNMSIDVPQNMSEAAANKVTTRISIVDRLINTRGQEINKLLEEGMRLENNIKLKDPNHKSYLDEKIREFIRLNESYKH